MPLLLLNADHLGSHTQNDTVTRASFYRMIGSLHLKKNMREIVFVVLKVKPRGKYC